MLGTHVEQSKLAAKVWDVAVVGAGPAGSSTAISLARMGHSVLLVDAKSFPRGKVCGGCLNAAALRLTETLVGKQRLQQLASITTDRFAIRSGDVHFETHLPAGRSVDRAEFDSMLAQAAVEAGATFLDETKAHEQESVADNPELDLRHRKFRLTCSARVVVSACGLGNRLFSKSHDLASAAVAGSRVGLATSLVLTAPEAQHYSNGTIYMAVGKPGYVGLSRLANGQLHLAAAIDKQAIGHSIKPSKLVEAILRDSQLAIPSQLLEATWQGTGELTRSSRSVADTRRFVIGDAAGYAEPFTGEGVRWALQGGISASHYIHHALLGDRAGAADGWNALHAHSIRKSQRHCRTLTRGLRSAMLTRTCIRLLRTAPWLARPTINRLNRLSHGTAPASSLPGQLEQTAP